MDYGNNGAGKGDSYRLVDQAKYSKNWDKIFKKKKTPKKLDKQTKRGII